LMYMNEWWISIIILLSPDHIVPCCLPDTEGLQSRPQL
jgi:hypothetical protein